MFYLLYAALVLFPNPGLSFSRRNILTTGIAMTLLDTKTIKNGDDDDCGDGAWGGAAYINDGWWAQQGDGTVTIKASGNIADWGAVGYATMVQQGSIIFGNNARGKWSQNSSQQKSWTFAGGGCSSSKISGFNCCEVDDKITCNN